MTDQARAERCPTCGSAGIRAVRPDIPTSSRKATRWDSPVGHCRPCPDPWHNRTGSERERILAVFDALLAKNYQPRLRGMVRSDGKSTAFDLYCGGHFTRDGIEWLISLADDTGTHVEWLGRGAPLSECVRFYTLPEESK